LKERSSEIWKTLSKVKTEFGKFGEVIDATKKKLEAAANQFETVDRRTRQINKALKGVELISLPDGTTLGLDIEEDGE
jgi:DNA recombination protein RmuC